MLNRITQTISLQSRQAITSMICLFALIGAIYAPIATASEQSRVNATTARLALIHALTDKAAHGNPDAQYALAEILRKEANGNKVILARATGWLVLAAKQGHHLALETMAARGMSLGADHDAITDNAGNDGNDGEDVRVGEFPPTLLPPAPFAAPAPQSGYAIILRPTGGRAQDAHAMLARDKQLAPYLLPQNQNQNEIWLGPYYSKADAVKGIERAAQLGAFTSWMKKLP
ncbi:MAG: hypothetical protein ABF335_10045 [Alphaproteobacteria bacterium]